MSVSERRGAADSAVKMKCLKTLRTDSGGNEGCIWLWLWLWLWLRLWLRLCVAVAVANAMVVVAVEEAIAILWARGSMEDRT